MKTSVCVMCQREFETQRDGVLCSNVCRNTRQRMPKDQRPALPQKTGSAYTGCEDRFPDWFKPIHIPVQIGFEK